MMWDVLSGDFDQRVSGEKCVRNVVDHARPGSIILFHDSLNSRDNMIYAFPKVVEHLLGQGYSFDLL